MKTPTKIAWPLPTPVAAIPLVALCCLLAPALSAQSWVQVSAAGPSTRAGHTMVFDPLLGETLLFGGYGGTPQGDTWSWNGQRWLRLAPAAAPSPRWHHAMAVDPVRGRTVLFGGEARPVQPFQYFDDTWEWDGSTWHAVASTSNPSPRIWHAMAFDPSRSRILLFGGYDGHQVLNDTWEWDGSTWTLLQPASRPSVRYAHGMVADPAQRTVTLFGGHTGASFLSDTWEWDGSTWVQRSPQQNPGARASHAMSSASALGRTLLFGGGSFPSPFGDTWVWEARQWQALAPTSAPPARTWSAMVSDPIRCRFVMFGGETAPAQWAGDTWELPLCGTYAAFGAGCPGARGLPHLSSATPPRIGLPFRIDLTNLPLNSAGVFFFGLCRSAWSIVTLPADLSALGMPGCQLLVSGDVPYVFASDSAGVAAWQPQSGIIPADPTLVGLGFFNQAFPIDLGFNAGNLITTNGGEGVIGR